MIGFVLLMLLQSTAAAFHLISSPRKTHNFVSQLGQCCSDDDDFDIEESRIFYNPRSIGTRRCVFQCIVGSAVVGAIMSDGDISNANEIFLSEAKPIQSIVDGTTTSSKTQDYDMKSIPSRAITMVKRPSPFSSSFGLEVENATIGSPIPRQVVVVRSVQINSLAYQAGAQPGMIILGYDSALTLLRQLGPSNPTPLRELVLYNLAAGGDAIGDDGKPILSAQQALDAAKQVSSMSSTNSNESTNVENDTTSGLNIQTIKKPSPSCAMQSRRGDLLSIIYEAHIGTKDGPIYDSTEMRNLPNFSFQLGNGDVIPGVDLGTNDMCPGEIRELDVPPQLAYGTRGSKLFRIPPNTRLWWRIQLDQLNFVSADDDNTVSREDRYEGTSGLLPVF